MKLISDLLQSRANTEQIDFSGWLRTKRDSKGGFSFLELYDGSCFDTIQVVVDRDVPGYEDVVLELKTGASVHIVGQLKESQGKGQSVEVQASMVELLGNATDEFPLQKKHQSFEHLRSIQHLRPRTNSIGAVLRLRSKISFAIHKFFQEQSFHYIHTPIITASDCEGAGNMFAVHSTEGAKGKLSNPNFFGIPTYLTVSGQLEGEACAMALGRIYTFGPTFRAENSNTSRHLAEFWMVEPEMAFAKLDDDAKLAEDFLKYVCKYTLEHCSSDLEFFNKRIDKTVLERVQALVEQPFERITYTEAIKILLKATQKFIFPVEWGLDLQSEHERYLTEKHFKGPVIVTDYPRDIKSFYMRLNDDEKTVRAMDVLVPGVGEIIGGSEREERLDVLESRMQAHDIDLAEYSWYLDLRRFGSAPHSGFGLGLERLVQYISGMENIRDVTAFPRTPKHARIHSAITSEQ